LGQDKEDKEGKKTRGKNRTELGSVKLTSKSRNALFFVLTLPCLLVYLSSLSCLNPNLKKPTLVSSCRGERGGWEKGLGDEGEISCHAFKLGMGSEQDAQCSEQDAQCSEQDAQCSEQDARTTARISPLLT